MGCDNGRGQASDDRRSSIGERRPSEDKHGRVIGVAGVGGSREGSGWEFTVDKELLILRLSRPVESF